VTPTQGQKSLSTTQLPSHPSQAQAQAHTQSQQNNPNTYQHQQHQQQQQQQQQQHAHPSYAHAHTHAAHSHAHTHSHVLAQSPSPPYTHVSHGSHGSSSFTPQNTLTPIATAAGSGGGHHHHQQQHQHQQQLQRGDSSGPGTPEGGISGDPNDPKKQRACESCRGLKVRCEADAANPDGPCRRCAKAGRNCVVTQPTRKRQKKTDNRVAELEKKIDALTASLQATRSSGGAAPPPHPMSSPEVGSVSAPGAGTVGGPLGRGAESSTAPLKSEGGGGFGNSPLAVRDWASQVRDQVRERSASSSTQRPSASKTLSSYGTIDVDTKEYSPPMTGQKRKHGDPREGGEDIKRIPSAPLQPPEEELPDLVDRGIITMAQAGELFRRYTDQMSPHLPAVVFPPDMTAAELRETKPILFHAVMAAASSEIPSIQKVLTKELMQVFAEKVIVIGQKSLELVQALHVAVIWYWPPEHFEELKFYQLVHVSAIMAIDIGLGRKKQAKGGFRKHIPQGWGDHPLKKNAPPDPTTIEARRTWLACYFLATNTAMALHRPNLIRWTPFMGECVTALESSPEAARTDKYFCHLIFTHKLAEEVGVLLSMDDPTSTPNLADSRTQYALKGFEREFERYSSSLPPEMMQRMTPPFACFGVTGLMRWFVASLQMSFHVLNLYMHEIATHNDFQDDIKQMPSTADPFREAFSSDAPLTPAHINAIAACLAAIDGIFEVFVSLDPADIRCLPVFNFVRVAYAVVVLIKMYFAAASAKSELGKVINKDNMKVEHHLEKLLAKFRATAADGKSRPATKFMVVLVMLRSWFQKQKQNPTGPGGTQSNGSKASSAPDNLPTPYQTHNIDKSGGAQPTHPSEFSTTANTPLQLLSEVATSETATPRTTNPELLPPTNANTAPWFSNNNAGGSRPQPQPYMYETNSGARTSAGADSGPPPPTSNLAPAGIGAPDQIVGNVMPWLNNAFSADFDYTSLGDDFAQAMDWSLEELADGNLGMGMENGMRYFMSEPPWFQQMQNMGMGMGMVDGMGGNAGGGGAQGSAVPGGGGMFPY